MRADRGRMKIEAQTADGGISKGQRDTNCKMG